MAEFIKFSGFEVCDAYAREQIEKLEKSKNKMVVFGDSWSDESVTDSIWQNVVSDELNLELLNYASNGAGFIQPTSNLIETQVNTFLSDDVDKTEVKYVLFVGGINDYRNGVTYQALEEKLATLIQTIKTNCEGTKIVYVSNCQYPYTQAQSKYWNNVHHELAIDTSITSLNLDGIIGKDLYNTSNYFHLTQDGYKWMARNIVALLTGGEIIKCRDIRTLTSSNGTLTYQVERISSNIAHVLVKLIPSVEGGRYDFAVGSSDVKLSYGNDTELGGIVSYTYRTYICDISDSSVVVAGGEYTSNGREYHFNYFVEL